MSVDILLHVSLWPYPRSTHGSYKRVLDYLELVVIFLVDAGNQTPPLEEQPMLLIAEPSLHPLIHILN